MVLSAIEVCSDIGYIQYMRSTKRISGRCGVRFGLMLFLLLAGCGRGSADLRVAVSLIPDQIDPVLSGQLDGWRIAAHVYESLLRQDETGALLPHLATTWDYDSTFTRLHIQLRSDVLFHDGSIMTAQDVAYSLERILAAAEEPDIRMGTSPYQMGNPLAVRVIGDLELEIEIPWPHQSLLKTLTTPFLVPIIKEGTGTSSPDSFPVGTGPYRLEAYSPLDGVAILDRNGEYWGPQPGPERIRFQAYEGDAERLEAIEAGEMDIALNVAVSSVEVVRKSELMDFVLTARKAWLVLSLNNQRPPFDDLSTRHALAEALNTGAIVRTQWQSAGELMHFFVGPGLDPDLRGRSAPEYNVEQAEVLAARNIGAGVDTLRFLRSQAAKRGKTEKLVSILQALLEPFGFEVLQYYCEDFEEYDELISSGAWHLSVDGFATDNGDLFSFLYEVYGRRNQDGSLGLFHMEDDGLLDLIEEANRAIEKDQREELFRTAINRIVDRVPCIPLADFKSFVVRSVDIEGLDPGPYSDWTFSSVSKANWK